MVTRSKKRHIFTLVMCCYISYSSLQITPWEFFAKTSKDYSRQEMVFIFKL